MPYHMPWNEAAILKRTHKCDCLQEKANFNISGPDENSLAVRQKELM